MVALAFAIVYIVWGSTYFFIHKALAGFGPFMLGAIRFTVAGLLMLAWSAYMKYPIFDKAVIRNASVTGLLLLYVDTGIIIWVEQFLASGLVAIMAASAAIWFVLLDKPRWKENFTNLPTIAGLFLGFFGVVMLFGEQVAMSADLSAQKANTNGMLLLLAGAIAWTMGSLYSKYAGKPSNPTRGAGTAGTAWQVLIAGIAFTLTAFARGEAQDFRVRDVPAEAWWAIAYLIIFGSIIAYSAYIWLLKVRPATEVSTYAYVNPIVAVLLSLFLTDERISVIQLTGLAVILMSVLLINWTAYRLPTSLKRRKREKTTYTKPSVRSKTRSSIALRADGKPMNV
ncbi:Permease of the drug/metabolite transporter (DMT) superfamily [Parapedobacter koreensis]|uniref:Permease of the drug/metabolite transporter (DMT) superfamily n=2 Tax=Parapedobacter koreensis TaxID=332977 RepID=A0A1H7LAV8_9SPHI|nr:Permease of the drug/metabolite transporter (DMT) superfamily [Parapedobacter koreensis]